MKLEFKKKTNLKSTNFGDFTLLKIMEECIGIEIVFRGEAKHRKVALYSKIVEITPEISLSEVSTFSSN